MHDDWVIKGGTVVDGTGGPARTLDVRVAGGRITELGARLTGDQVLDASGAIVAPGFFDIHTHNDAQVFWDSCSVPPGSAPIHDAHPPLRRGHGA